MHTATRINIKHTNQDKKVYNIVNIVTITISSTNNKRDSKCIDIFLDMYHSIMMNIAIMGIFLESFINIDFVNQRFV